MQFPVSIGIMAYNEEAIIGMLLQAILEQQLYHVHLQEIFVVASGCTDNTENIVRHYMQKDRRIKLLVQPQREGKASAINLFLANASGDIMIVESADTVPLQETLEKLVTPFLDPKVGMTGAHPMPINSKDSFIGFTVHLMWTLHHKIAMKRPKLGELVAFRSVVREIPESTAVDEASIEAIVVGKGYELCYVPEAIVKNKGPENVRDLIKQRRRIAAGHLYLARERQFEVSTRSPITIFKVLIPELSWNLKESLWVAGAIIIEGASRLLGLYDVFFKKANPYIWDIAPSTKTWK